MPESNEDDAREGQDQFDHAMRAQQGGKHKAQTDNGKDHGLASPVAHRAPADAERGDGGGGCKAVFVDLRSEQKVPADPEAGDENDRCKAMDRAKAGHGDSHLIDKTGFDGWRGQGLGHRQRHVCYSVTLRKELASHALQFSANALASPRPPAHLRDETMATIASPLAVDPALNPSRARPLAIARWLEIVAAFVVLIVLVGGITRLTESGLSITEWNVATGILPPLSDSAWEAEFAKYRATPEYRLEASLGGMTLAEFRFIYFWEWFHRLLARMVGLVYALPLVWFWLKGAIPQGFKPRFVALLALGGLQGLFGWLMVQSGLVGDMTDVSHFRLSLHLLTALLLLALLVWTARDMRHLARTPGARAAPLTLPSTMVALVLFVQLLLGAWVAGLNAGHVAYDWPLMNGRLIPELDFSRGFFVTLTNDPLLLHFLHRWWAWVAVAALVYLGRRVRKADRAASIAVHSAFGVMVILGIATVMTEVSLWVAAAHQLTGALLVASTARAMHSDGISRQTA